MMVMMHAEAEKGGDTEKGRQKPALQQKTTDDEVKRYLALWAYIGSQIFCQWGLVHRLVA